MTDIMQVFEQPAFFIREVSVNKNTAKIYGDKTTNNKATREKLFCASRRKSEGSLFKQPEGSKRLLGSSSELINILICVLTLKPLTSSTKKN